MNTQKNTSRKKKNTVGKKSRFIVRSVKTGASSLKKADSDLSTEQGSIHRVVTPSPASRTISTILAIASAISIFTVLNKFEGSESQEEKILRQNAVINLLYQESLSKLVHVLALSGFSLLLLSSASWLGKIPHDAEFIFFLPFIPATLAWLRIAVTRYRVLRGYYGNNANEASELIAFIERISDEIPPSGGGGMKAFPKEVIERKESFGGAITGEPA